MTIIRSHKKEKIKAAVSLIANAMLKESDPDKLSYTEADHFSRALEQVSIGSYSVLSAAYEIANEAYGGNLAEACSGDSNSGRRFSFEELSKKLPQYDSSLLMGLVGELDSLNLLHKAGTPTIKTQNYANYPIELTILGVRFVVSVLDEANSE